MRTNLIDIVKPRPDDSLKDFEAWVNRMQSELVSSFGKKIEVVERYDCAECGIETDYYKFGGICGRCEARSERFDV